MGRISLTLHLTELPLSDCVKFWTSSNQSISSYEKFKLLSVTGGVPRYLEEINPCICAEDNINNLCFQKEGVLFQEFQQIFSDLFERRANLYKDIVIKLAFSNTTMDEIASTLGMEKSNRLSNYLDDLIKAGFIRRNYTWRISDGRASNLSTYRLSDNYLRFYIRYILPNKEKIEKGDFNSRSAANLPAWTSIMSLQFENLVLNNRIALFKLLNLDPSDIINDNSFFQRATARQPGCQIDYLIQTRFDTLYVCEIKFSRNPVSKTVIKEVKNKIERLKTPKSFSIRPVLIHVNGVTEDLIDEQFFHTLVEFGYLTEQ